MVSATRCMILMSTYGEERSGMVVDGFAVGAARLVDDGLVWSS